MTRIAMKTVKSAKVNIFWAFVVASVCLQVTYSIKWKKYVHSMEFDGQVCAKEQVLFHEENVFFQVTCGTMCIMNSECAGVSYQSETHTCIGCREALDLFRGQNERFPGSSHSTRKRKLHLLRILLKKQASQIVMKTMHILYIIGHAITIKV
jgi:hypothetical protein